MPKPLTQILTERHRYVNLRIEIFDNGQPIMFVSAWLFMMLTP